MFIFMKKVSFLILDCPRRAHTQRREKKVDMCLIIPQIHIILFCMKRVWNRDHGLKIGPNLSKSPSASFSCHGNPRNRFKMLQNSINSHLTHQFSLISIDFMCFWYSELIFDIRDLISGPKSPVRTHF